MPDRSPTTFADGGTGLINGKIAVAVPMLFSAILLLAGFTAGTLACVVLTGMFWARWWFSKASDARALTRQAVPGRQPTRSTSSNQAKTG